MYFNILQTLVMAAVIYFIACWLLSRLAEWLPSRMQQRTAAPAEPEPLAPIAAGDPSNVNQIAVAKEVEELPLGGTPAQIPCASPWHQRLDSQLAAHPLRTGI